MTLVPAMIAWSTTAKVHLVSVDRPNLPDGIRGRDIPAGNFTYCGMRLPYPGQIWEVGEVPLTCKRCFAKASKDSRFHAEADCPDCGRHLTRPLGHLILTHGWDREEARRWVRREAVINTRTSFTRAREEREENERWRKASKDPDVRRAFDEAERARR